MAEWLFLVSNVFTYVWDNVSCLTYSIELLATNISYIMSYNDLLVDISESFAIWVVVLVLISSYITTLAIAHNSTSSNKHKNNKLPLSRSYSSLLKYNSFKNKI